LAIATITPRLGPTAPIASFGSCFVPLIFLGAYRVYETPRGGIVFIGRHPLPMWAQVWNALGIAVACVLAYMATRAAIQALW